ncbi:MAG: heme-binding protein [Planctomycetota bacterium]
MILSAILLSAAAGIPAPAVVVEPAIAATLLEGEIPKPPPTAVAEAKRRATALKALESRLPEGLSDQDQVRAAVRRAVAASVALGEDSETGRVLKQACRRALAASAKTPKAAALLVDLVREGARRDLAFQPIMEAPLPKGFPWPVAAGEIQVQEYPVYRKVVTGMQGSQQNGAFFKLFRHITSNDIAMTAPVEMTMGENEMLDMAFLYGKPDMGSAGEAGRVEVTDIEPMTVVSIGIRGTTRNVTGGESMAKLEAWLERNKDQWEQAGNPRLMGYNGPMTPRSKQFCEIQIPIRAKAASE